MNKQRLFSVTIAVLATIVISAVVLPIAVEEIRVAAARNRNENNIRNSLNMSRSTTVDAARVRDALLAKLPIGCTRDQVVAFLKGVETNRDVQHSDPAQTGELRLAFKLGRKPIWGILDEGLDIRFIFDDQQRLSDLAVIPSS